MIVDGGCFKTDDTLVVTVVLKTHDRFTFRTSFFDKVEAVHFFTSGMSVVAFFEWPGADPTKLLFFGNEEFARFLLLSLAVV